MTYVQPHLALQEWVSYLRLWNKLDREARSVEQDAETPETRSQFDRKAAAFLQMFGNTTDIIGYPIHNCSSSCVLREQKQGSPEGCRCNGKSLSDLRAIRSSPQQMVQAFWTDFCASGSLFRNWLPEVFSEAFARATFKQFDSNAPADLDPWLVESLAFHEVNGRQLRASIEFLGDVTVS